MSKNAGALLKPHIPLLIAALLEALSSLEPQALNTLSLQVTSNQDTVEKVGIVTSWSPYWCIFVLWIVLYKLCS